MEVKYLPIKILKEYPDNAKAHPDHQVKKIAMAIKEFHWDQPIVVDNDLVIIKGHGRLRAARELGLERVPVVIADYLTPEQVRAARIADNKIAESEWMPEVLAREFRALQELDFDLELTGFDLDELEEYGLKTAGNYEPPDDPGPDLDLAAELQQQWGTALGQIWQVGRHKLMCGSCVDGRQLFNDEKYALLVTDPPYGVSYASKNEFLNAVDKGNKCQSEIVNDHKTPEEMAMFWTETFTGIRAHAIPGASYYITGPQVGDLLLLLLLSLKEAKFPLRHMLVWAKNNHVLGRSDYHYKHEPILYGWVDGAGHTFYGGRGETSLWEVDKPLKSEFHPTMKPVELFSRAIKNSSQENDLVYDPFIGSGTTMVAAEQLGRICYGMEIAPEYVAVTLERLSKMGLEPELLETVA